MIDDLKPCPFCGGNNVVMDHIGSVAYDSVRYFASCDEAECGASGPDRKTPEDAAAAWHSPRTENQRLREALADALVLAEEGIGNSGEGKAGARLSEVRVVLDETER